VLQYKVSSFSISHDTVFSFDLGRARHLRPNPCPRVFVPHPSVCRFHLVSIYPHTPSSSRVDARIQGIMPSATTLVTRSTKNQRGNRTPILATVRLYRVLQLAVFVFCPFTRTSIRPVDVRIQDTAPSHIRLMSRSTWDQNGNCGPILGTVSLYCIPQFDVFVFCPFTRTPLRSVDDAGI
jgi:hypothetical protein